METEFYNVSSKLCDGGHICIPPKECCSLGCCNYLTVPQIGNSILEILRFLFWYYWYLWIALLAGLVVVSIYGCWLCRKRQSSVIDDESISDRVCYYPAHYSRCNSTAHQALIPPYSEVTAKPDLYPLVIDFDEGFVNKDTTGFVMRCFRSLSRASTLDSLSSSFMCNLVNEANMMIPPPYSCNNSIDELSSIAASTAAIAGAISYNNNNNNNLSNSNNNNNNSTIDRPLNFDDGSIVSLNNHRTTSDVSSLAAQSPLSPPRATSPTLELRELLEKIQQLPQLPASQQNRPKELFNLDDSEKNQQQTSSSSTSSNYNRNNTRRIRGKSYLPIGPPPSSSTNLLRTNKSRSWLSRSAPTTPSGSITSPSNFFVLPNNLQSNQSNQNQNSNDSNRQQVIPLLLAEQDETDNPNNLENS